MRKDTVFTLLGLVNNIVALVLCWAILQNTVLAQEEEEVIDDIDSEPQSFEEDYQGLGGEDQTEKLRAIIIKGIPGRDIRTLCQYISLDGRSELFYALISSNLYDPTQCVTCKQIVSRFVAGCKPKRETAEEKPSSRRRAKGKEVEEPGASEPSKEAGEDQAAGEQTAAGEGAAEGTEAISDEHGEAAAGESTPLQSPTPIPIIPQREPSIDVIYWTTKVFNDLAENRNADSVLPFIDYMLLLFSESGDTTPGARAYLETLGAYINASFSAVRRRVREEEEARLENESLR